MESVTDELREFTRLMAQFGMDDAFVRARLGEIADKIDRKAEDECAYAARQALNDRGEQEGEEDGR